MTSTSSDRRRFLLTSGAIGTAAAAAVALPASPVGATAPNDWQNVKADYSAAGNGTGDDRAAIQAAIDNAATALGTNPLKGGVVWLPPGQYNIGGSLLMRSGVTLCGSGVASRIFLTGGAGDVPAIIIQENADTTPVAYAVVRDLSLGSGTPHSSGRHGIAIRSNNSGGGGTPYTGSDSYPLIMNVQVSNFGGHGVAIGIDPPSGTADVREFRCLNVVVFGCARAATGDRAGIWVNATDGFLIGCTVASCDGPGYHILKANNRLDGCKAFFNEHEFLVQGNRNQLANCQAQDGFLDGFRVEPVSGTLTNASFTGCQADSNTNAGFRITNVTTSTFVGSTAFLRGGRTSTGPAFALTGTTKCLITGTVNGLTVMTGTNTSGTNQIVS
jgi:hypothetical protein